MNTTKIQRDVVIIGAGMAGLWLHFRLKQLGLQSIIIENQHLGTGQTIASQGIIHGGTKYTLTGKITHAAQTLTDMPQTWRHALQNSDSPILPDLTSARILAPHQFLCSAASLTSKFTAFAAGKVIQSRVTALRKQEWPKFLDHQTFAGNVYQLDEPILDIPSILDAFLQQIPNGEILLVNPQNSFQITSQSHDPQAVIRLQKKDGNTIDIHTPHLIFTAGVGNEQLKTILQDESFQTQRRPLQMTIVRFTQAISKQLKPIYSHFLGSTALPRATITTHYTKHTDQLVLYIGGEIAETGIRRGRAAQIQATRKLLKQILPDYADQPAEWATYHVDRAEPLQPGMLRPDNAVFTEHGNIIAAWPTKMALAPYLANEIASHLKTKKESHPVVEHDPQNILQHWPRPKVASAPWDQEELQWTS